MRVKKKDRNKKWAFLFIFSNLLLFIVFFVWPALLGVAYSFTNYSGMNATFVGLDNYIRLFQDPGFYKAMSRTFLYTALGVPFVYCASLLVSVLLVSNHTRGKTVAKTIFFFPWLVSPIVTGVLWRWMFGESFGFVNYIISALGGEPLAWSSNGNLAFLVVLLATAWAGTAFNMLIFIAALLNVPKAYYEASEIDGANGWQKFWHITLPSLRSTSFLVILLSIFGLMKEFPMVQALTNGGPGTDNTFIVQYIYQTGFAQMRIGYASAASMVLFVILLVFALLQFKFVRGGRVDG
ncbi:alpha-1,4-digalacturonate transport system permease protein [Evansella caseinilytica]|uniref:Alpha-1,4-digalacturonate transport system permease protein n=1 Tax=Evansella caseinilytica TaxID=1503961 RepID=A0A1H3UUC6_9BACI|nr:sugar ABC transporter permease [Evansella caseinilytica]SDZ65856.1 alpha-1,4-digalacturonate transport system permease protein [Evansella caseinilytica]